MARRENGDEKWRCFREDGKTHRQVVAVAVTVAKKSNGWLQVCIFCIRAVAFACSLFSYQPINGTGLKQRQLII
jgi:hypothetical protein